MSELSAVRTISPDAGHEAHVMSARLIACHRM
jgi:hypothetical protein